LQVRPTAMVLVHLALHQHQSLQSFAQALLAPSA
jgi:hypothetical protein